jgi:hypothetical protein
MLYQQWAPVEASYTNELLQASLVPVMETSWHHTKWVISCNPWISCGAQNSEAIGFLQRLSRVKGNDERIPWTVSA